MKAIILAGGFARRLKPVTNNLPKCLLTVGTKTIIDHQIETLRENGVFDVVVITGFKARILEQHLRATQPQSRLLFIENERFLETGPAYGLWIGREHFDQDLIYLNGDLFCDKQIIKKLIESKEPTITALRRAPWDDEQVKIVSKDETSVISMGKKIEEQQSYGEFIGATKLSRDFLRTLQEILEGYILQLQHNKFAADSLSDTIQKGRRMAILDVSALRAIEIDTIEDLSAARKIFTNPTKLKTALKLLFGYVLRLFGYVVPKRKKLWVFYGWHKNREREVFADNSKYLFLAASEDPEIEAVWLGQDEKICSVLQAVGYKALPINSWKGAWTALRARYTIVDALLNIDSWKYSGGSRLIQLWHGKGMKKTGYNSPYSFQRYNRLLYPSLFVQYSRLLASSPYTAYLMSSTFREPMKNILTEGLPRTDVFFENISGSKIDADTVLENHLQAMKRSASQKVILYAPTFRPDGSNPLDQIDFEKLHVFLKERNYHLILSLHPKFAQKLYYIPADQDHLKIIDAGLDIYPFLKEFDLLITDYSSLYVDFLLLNRPIIFYTYDLGKYEREMGLHEDFKTLTPGPKVSDFEILLQEIQKQDQYQEQREEVRQKLFEHTHGKAAQRILKRLKSERRR